MPTVADASIIDLERFTARPPLPSAPRRALFLSHYAREDTHLPVVREACARRGLRLDVRGYGAGEPVRDPERILGDYDIVFAKARCALEAMAVGSAVVLCDIKGAGPMVTSGELDRLRRLNFGIRTLREEIHADVLEKQIARYDPADAATVTGRIRDIAGRGAALDQITALYEQVIFEFNSGGARDLYS